MASQRRIGVQSFLDEHPFSGFQWLVFGLCLFMMFCGFPLGAAFGGFLAAWINADRIIAIGYALTSLAIYAIGQAVGNVGLLVATVFIAGSFLVAELARRQLGFGDIFLVVALPGLLAALALAVKLLGNPNRSPASAALRREALSH